MTSMRAATAAASLVLAAALAPAPAAATAGVEPDDRCRDSEVTVVVDFAELGGAETACAAPGTAGDVFDAAGHTLEYLPQQAFVCRVDGEPADGPCFETDAYWSLWWARPGEDWTYATLGVTSLEIPAGAAVGFAWHQGEGDAEPPAMASADVAGGDEVAGAADRAQPDDPAEVDGIPPWGYAALVVLALGAAAVPLVRRRRS